MTMRQLATMRHPIVFLLLGALVAVAVLLLSASAALTADMTKVQGESMTRATGISVVNDSNAEPTGAGKAIRYTASATARQNVTYTKGATQIVVLARKEGTNANHPLLRVFTKTGTQSPVLRGTATVSSTSYQEYTFTFSANSGTHQVQVRGDNIASGRLLRVDYFRIPEAAPTVDTTPPETTITSGPSGSVSGTTATFGFTSEPGSTFQCQLLGLESAPASCTSPESYSGLTAGTEYTFSVRATDASGNADATPATRSFTPSGDAPSAAKPNFVFILTDDMRYDDLEYMQKTRFALKDKGMTFTSAFVTTALCCPSRATIMRGQYAHNTGVWFNISGPSGGWEGYKSRRHEEDNVATQLNGELNGELNGAGYRTGLFGKYFNDYGGTTVPPGWDDWFGFIGQGEYFNYDVNDNGTMRHFGTGEGAYSTDVLSAQTQEFIDASVGAGEPFFAYVAPKAPHITHVAAPRHETLYDGAQAPRPPTSPAFDEEDVSDKPSWIRSLPRLTSTQIAQIDNEHEKRVETLQAVDDLVEAVVNKLHSRGALSNTYVVFTSDNGFHLGEHRIPDGKARPYEENIRVPLLVRGPGVQAASTTDKLVLNTDFLPTFTDLAGTTTPPYVDGRSLRPVLTESARSWRTAILLEGRGNRGFNVPYYGIRTTTNKYVEYEGGERELYTLSTDPYEMSSTPTSSSASSLQTRLQALKGCAADSCRAAENGP
jgi:N-acetylglucosamine-6-sulfatase